MYDAYKGPRAAREAQFQVTLLKQAKRSIQDILLAAAGTSSVFSYLATRAVARSSDSVGFVKKVLK